MSYKATAALTMASSGVTKSPLQLSFPDGANHEEPRTALGESVEEVFGFEAAQTLKNVIKGFENGKTARSIDDYIALARIGESGRRHLSEHDPWLESLLVVKQRLGDMDNAATHLSIVRNVCDF